MTHVTCRLTAKNRDQLRNFTLGNRVWASFLFYVEKERHTLHVLGREILVDRLLPVDGEMFRHQEIVDGVEDVSLDVVQSQAPPPARCCPLVSQILHWIEHVTFYVQCRFHAVAGRGEAQAPPNRG